MLCNCFVTLLHVTRKVGKTENTGFVESPRCLSLYELSSKNVDQDSLFENVEVCINTKARVQTCAYVD